ncbi:MAG: DUF3501 family protein [Bacteroidetes bacterium]|nr:DUF3501 family protein [Bacteroidota bacterium]
MKKIEFSDVKNIHEYEKVRKESRDHIIKIKKNRRIQIGDNITLVFENRETVLFQIQEMIRLEKIADRKLIQQEIDVYNELIPCKNQLCATMLIEIQEREYIKPILDSLIGLSDKCVFLEFDNEKIEPIFDQGQLTDGRVSAVQYLTFSFKQDQVKKFVESGSISKIKIQHKNYKAEKTFDPEMKTVLINDLTSE